MVDLRDFDPADILTVLTEYGVGGTIPYTHKTWFWGRAKCRLQYD